MLGWIIQTSIMSILLIVIMHSLFNWFIDTLTIPKTKDFVSFSADKYDKIYGILSTKSNTQYNENIGGETTSIYSLPNINSSNSSTTNIDGNELMKNELINFLKTK